MPTRPRRRTFFSLLLTLLLAAYVGCGAAETVETFPMLRELPRPAAIVLLPAEVHFRGMQAHHYYDYWVDLAELLSRRTGLPVLGPDEYSLRTDNPVTEPLRDTDALRGLEEMGVSADSALAIRVRIIESWQQGESLMGDGPNESFRNGQFQSSIEFQAEIVHFGTGHPLVSLTSTLEIDSLPSPTEADPRPDLTGYYRDRCERAVTLVLDRCRVAAAPEGSPEAHAVVLEGPQGAARQRYQDLPSVVDQTARADEIDRDVALLARIGFRHPMLPRDVERQLLKLGPDTLLVQRAADCTGLLPGDVLTRIGDKPATHAFALLRAESLARAASRPLSLTVTRGPQPDVPISWRCW